MAHDLPFRLRVLHALTAQLQTISVANGYHVDLDGKVFRGVNTFGDDYPIPMLSILESILEPEQATLSIGSQYQEGPWELLIQGWMDDDAEHPTDPGHFLLADVKKCLVAAGRFRYPDYPVKQGYDILGMDGKITALKFSRGVVRPADEVSAKAYFWLKLELTLIEDLSDPYA